MSQSTTISKAFVLGAGLGTRLRPLTESMPKPLVPVWNAPLISYAFDHLIHDLATRQFIINTHHAAERYQQLFPNNTYRDCQLEFRYEPTLLDTAGGIDNIRDWLPAAESFIVYNGDILTDLPLEDAAIVHLESGNLVTLVLRSQGQNRNVAYDPTTGRVNDMRNALGTNSTSLYQFTGIYLVSPEFLAYLNPGKIESVVEPFLKAIINEQGVGGVIIDEGYWSDLGDHQSYLGALHLLAKEEFPMFGLHRNKCRIHPTANISPSASVDHLSSIGAQSVIGDQVTITESVVWPHAQISSGATVTQQVILP